MAEKSTPSVPPSLTTMVDWDVGVGKLVMRKFVVLVPLVD
jgi:hypothetical protein